MARRGKKGTRGPQRPDQKKEVRPPPMQPFGNTIVGDLGPEELLALARMPSEKVTRNLRRIALSRMMKRSF